MIKTYEMLKKELSGYSDIDNKIARLVKAGELIRINKGVYETDKDTPGFLLAGSIYGPSYLSFDYALYFYGLINEPVEIYTSATYEKKKIKKFTNHFGQYVYRDIPVYAYMFFRKTYVYEDYEFEIATPEKALCDKLYSLPPVANKKELIKLLFSDLKINEKRFNELDYEVLEYICGLYKSKNLNLLKKILKETNKKESE